MHIVKGVTMNHSVDDLLIRINLMKSMAEQLAVMKSEILKSSEVDYDKVKADNIIADIKQIALLIAKDSLDKN